MRRVSPFPTHRTTSPEPRAQSPSDRRRLTTVSPPSPKLASNGPSRTRLGSNRVLSTEDRPIIRAQMERSWYAHLSAQLFTVRLLAQSPMDQMGTVMVNSVDATSRRQVSSENLQAIRKGSRRPLL